jgi:hypothetical protein
MIAIQIFLSIYQICMPNNEADFTLCLNQMTQCYFANADLKLPEDEMAIENCSENIDLGETK